MSWVKVIDLVASVLLPLSTPRLMSDQAVCFRIRPRRKYSIGGEEILVFDYRLKTYEAFVGIGGHDLSSIHLLVGLDSARVEVMEFRGNQRTLQYINLLEPEQTLSPKALLSFTPYHSHFSRSGVGFKISEDKAYWRWVSETAASDGTMSTVLLGALTDPDRLIVVDSWGRANTIKPQGVVVRRVIGAGISEGVLGTNPQQR